MIFISRTQSSPQPENILKSLDTTDANQTQTSQFPIFLVFETFKMRLTFFLNRQTQFFIHRDL